MLSLLDSQICPPSRGLGLARRQRHRRRRNSQASILSPKGLLEIHRLIRPAVSPNSRTAAGLGFAAASAHSLHLQPPPVPRSWRGRSRPQRRRTTASPRVGLFLPPAARRVDIARPQDRRFGVPSRFCLGAAGPALLRAGDRPFGGGCRSRLAYLLSALAHRSAGRLPL